MAEHLPAAHREVQDGYVTRYHARCSCGWEADTAGNLPDARDAYFAHLTAAGLTNACRHCFAPIDGWGPLFCGDVCRKAAARNAEARDAAVAAHREEPERILPGPDQAPLW